MIDRTHFTLPEMNNSKRREERKEMLKEDKKRRIELQYGMVRNSLEPVRPIVAVGSCSLLLKPILFSYIRGVYWQHNGKATVDRGVITR